MAKKVLTARFESARSAQSALEQAREKFLYGGTVSTDLTWRKKNIVYFPSGIATVSDKEVEMFLDQCDGAID